MKTDIQALWTGALRSGDYTQGSGVLRTPSGDFCCLGVLCEIAVEAGVIPPAKKTEALDGTALGYHYGTETGVLPEAVIKWSGLGDSEGTYEMDDEELSERYGDFANRDSYYRKTSLINANDSYGKNFSQIADLIEKHF